MSHQESAKPHVRTKEAFINTCSVKGWMSYLDEKKVYEEKDNQDIFYYIAS